ncbi:MAG TPA: DUF5996 family protein [Acidobacteriaceae bacterium]|nr:DUF5996 family protein [Acidobacteriaceae bacterium]
MDQNVWPEFPQERWGETGTTLQLWMQIVGKVRLALTPPLNQTWNVTLYPTVRGFTTLPMWHGTRVLEIDFDLLNHELHAQCSNGAREVIKLQPMTVADFYGKVMAALDALGTPVKIWTQPMEMESAIPFEKDETHKAYDAEIVQRFWRILLQTERVFAIFRARFTGKVSPIHLFWGAMDMACTRFSGRTAPEHASMPGLPDRVTRDAYSHEVSSVGFWPGTKDVGAFFYGYAYPEPKSYREYKVSPKEARFDEAFGEFVFPYEVMRKMEDPDGALLDFLQSTYEAAANLAKWDRAALEVSAQRTADAA